VRALETPADDPAPVQEAAQWAHSRGVSDEPPPQREFDERASREDEERDRRREMELVEELDQRRREIDRIHDEIEHLEAQLHEQQGGREAQGRPDSRQAMERLRHALELRQRDFQRLREERMRAGEQREIQMQMRRLAYVNNWQGIAFNPARAVMLATQSIVEVNVRRGDHGQAEEVLTSLLERIEDVGARTAVRFALKELYGAMRQPEKAVQQMEQVVIENAQLLETRRPHEAPPEGR